MTERITNAHPRVSHVHEDELADLVELDVRELLTAYGYRYLLSAAEGGRRTEIRTGCRPQFYVRTTDVAGLLDPGEGVAAIPGDTVGARIELGKPVALDGGSTFAIREGGRTVGAGTVTALLD